MSKKKDRTIVAYNNLCKVLKEYLAHFPITMDARKNGGIGVIDNEPDNTIKIGQRGNGYPYDRVSGELKDFRKEKNSAEEAYEDEIEDYSDHLEAFMTATEDMNGHHRTTDFFNMPRSRNKSSFGSYKMSESNNVVRPNLGTFLNKSGPIAKPGLGQNMFTTRARTSSPNRDMIGGDTRGFSRAPIQSGDENYQEPTSFRDIEDTDTFNIKRHATRIQEFEEELDEILKFFASN